MSSTALALVLCSLLACGVAEDFPGVAAMCFDQAGTDCKCTGFLIAPGTVVSAKHCSRNLPPGAHPPRYAIFGRDDPADTSTGVSIRIDSRCSALTGSGYETCQEIALHTDLDLLFLDDPVSDSVTVPVRIGTNDDLEADGSDRFGVGYGEGTLRSYPFLSPSVACSTPFLGSDLCISEPGAGENGVLEGGDSGSPLFVRTADGELSVLGMYHGGNANRDIYQDLNAYAHLLPGVRRPPLVFPDLNEFYPWRRQCVWPIGELAPLVVMTSMQVDDFDGDGDDDMFFEVDQDVPRLLLGPDFAEIQTSPLLDEPVYPYTIVSGTWTDRTGLAAVDRRFRLRTFLLEGTEWVTTPLPDVDLQQYDSLWNLPDLDQLGDGQPNLETDPLLRPGDLNGDGQTDIIGVLADNLVIFENQGQSWAVQPHPFEELGLPNEAAYREAITLADLDPAISGDEIIARDACGLIIYGYSANGLFELYRQNCEDDPWVLSDEHGYDQHNRWQIATGNLNGDACADIMVRSASQVHQLFSNCDPLVPLTFEEGPDPGASWLEPFAGYPGWGAGDFGGRMRLADLDGDGLDDLIGNGPHGLQGRGNQNNGRGDLPFGSVGGLDLEHTGAVSPLSRIEDWRTVKAGHFDYAGAQLTSISIALGCIELLRWSPPSP